nr:helix-turn-helix transcriptional regulator [Rhodococcus opacus]
MVAAGLSNRQIADRLFVSVRTVESHIYRACMKLDVDDRNVRAESMATTVRCRRAGLRARRHAGSATGIVLLPSRQCV